MWNTSTTDTKHNMFGLPIQNPPRLKGLVDESQRVHDPYVLFKDPSFDMAHYISIDSIKLIQENPFKTKRILLNILDSIDNGNESALLELGPKDVERFLSQYLEKRIKLQGIERAYDRFYKIPYHIFYYVELLDLPG